MLQPVDIRSDRQQERLGMNTMLERDLPGCFVQRNRCNHRRSESWVLGNFAVVAHVFVYLVKAALHILVHHLVVFHSLEQILWPYGFHEFACGIHILQPVDVFTHGVLVVFWSATLDATEADAECLVH